MKIPAKCEIFDIAKLNTREILSAHVECIFNPF